MHDDGGDDEDTVLRPIRGVRPGGSRAAARDLDDTVLRRPSPADAVAGREADDLDDTVLRPVRRQVPGRGHPAASDKAEDIEDIEDTVLRPPVRRGRHAAPGSVPGDIDDTVVRPARGPRPGGTTAEDLDSTVIRPGRARPAMPPGPGPGTGGVPAATSGPAGAAHALVEPPAAPRAPADLADLADLAVPAGPGQGLPAVPGPTERVPSIRVGDRVIRLDRTVILGRRPAPPRVVRGPTPELVPVPSPRHEVSSSHLAVSASGTAVVVEDLGSTNGTVIRPVGAAPIRMPAGGSMVVLTGTVVEIGDGNSIEILSPHLRVHPQVGVSDRADPWPPASNPRHAPRAESDPDT